MSNSDREQRLAAKLRENLRRRKSQAKARSAEPDEKDSARPPEPPAPQPGQED